ncbi:MAG: hypothetical protein Q4E99_02025, partial [Bacillota bacterium]|nr:hypothetical protein [Bacillota bacterium]
KDLVYNSKAYVNVLRRCFEYFVCGSLNVPSGDDIKDAYYGIGANADGADSKIFDLPVFAHPPVPEDITDKMIEEIPGFRELKQVCAKNFRNILGMFCDNKDGTVWVRIFKRVDGKVQPCYVKIQKMTVYMKWVLLDRYENLWTGLIKEALQLADIDYSNMSGLELLSSCFGEELDINSFKDEVKDDTYYLTHFNEKSILEYARSVYEIYLNMMSTTSFKIEIQEKGAVLLLSIKRLMTIMPVLIDQPKEFIKEIMDTLSEQTAIYKEQYKDVKDKRTVLRMQICDSIESLYKIYNLSDAQGMRPYSTLKKAKQKG